MPPCCHTCIPYISLSNIICLTGTHSETTEEIYLARSISALRPGAKTWRVDFQSLTMEKVIKMSFLQCYPAKEQDNADYYRSSALDSKYIASMLCFTVEQSLVNNALSSYFTDTTCFRTFSCFLGITMKSPISSKNSALKMLWPQHSFLRLWLFFAFLTSKMVTITL